MPPEQTGPTIPTTPLTLISLVTASTPATGSHMESARTITYSSPLANIPPCSFMCFSAKSTANAIGATKSGIGPVIAIGLPTFTSAFAPLTTTKAAMQL